MDNETRKRVEEDLISIIRADLAHQKEYRPSSKEKFRSEGYIRSIMHIEEYFKEMQEETEEGKEVDITEYMIIEYDDIEEEIGEKLYQCTNCAKANVYGIYGHNKFCPDCGQKLIWPDSEKGES